MDPTLPTIDFRDFWFLAPAIVLAVWGLVVLLVDLGLAADEPRRSAGRWSAGWRWLGPHWHCVAAVGLIAGSAARPGSMSAGSGSVRRLSPSLHQYFGRFRGDDLPRARSSADLQTGIFNVLFIVLLGLVIWMSMAWSFTEEWGEYFALFIWATVGMMLLAASEELVTLFLTLETMTICLYLSTAFEKTRQAVGGGGLKYFVYGSVSSALFLFGLSHVYGLTGTTQFEAIRLALTSSAGTVEGPRGQRGRGDGAPADAGRLRLQGGGGPVPPVGPRRLRGGPGAG